MDVPGTKDHTLSNNNAASHMVTMGQALFQVLYAQCLLIIANIILLPFGRWRNVGTERFCHLPKVTQSINEPEFGLWKLSAKV